MTEQTTEEKLSVSGEEGSGADRALRRQRMVWILAVLALFAAGIAAMTAGGLAGRFYRFGAIPTWAYIWAMPACWTAGTVLYMAFAPRLCRYRKWVWVTCAAVLALVTAPLWGVAWLAASWADDSSNVVAIEVSPDGRYEAVTEEFYDLIDPSCRVWLRERGGVFSRQALVWERIEANCPTHVSFTGDTAISITEGGAQRPITTTFDADRMRVAQILPTPKPSR
ncbi:hypothetical protein AB0M45_18865 [Nocardia sp. NPDC051787]|uniref:hypothetical protein n=1 Tax=Nocardia sp. NPDC051787 TaxID=3155415 RepID=UPI00344168B0